MALIYASAVNKRMHPPKKRSLNDGNNCMETSYTSHYRQRSNEDRSAHVNCAFEQSRECDKERERSQRKRSTSQNSCSNSSCCQTPPPNSTADNEHEFMRMHHSHVQGTNRSKTHAHDSTPHRKLTTIQTNNSRPPPRKISSPLMSQSVFYEPTFKQHSAMKNNLRKNVVKKQMAKENHACREEMAQLAVSDDNSDYSDKDEPIVNNPKARKRRSLSFDASKDKEIHKLVEKNSVPAKPESAFQRMCSRLKKWQLHM